MDGKTLLTEIDAFLAASGMNEKTFGRRAFNHWGFVSQLRAGRRCWPETIAKVRAFMDAARQERAGKGRAKS